MNIVFVFRIVHALFAIITLYFITQYLTPEEQGWYYTFLSFSALIHLFDFGLSMALVHASAIEFVKLKWGNSGLIIGENYRNFKDFISIAFIKYKKLGLIFFIIIFPFGIYYFSQSQTAQNHYWLIPWFIHCSVAALSLLCIPFLSIVEGSGNLKEIYTLKIIQIIIGSTLCCLLIYFNYPLIAPSMILFSLVLTTLLWLIFYRNNNLPVLSDSNNSYKWKENIGSFKNKVGITFLGSYLFAQIYTPILFYFENPELAGQFSLSLAIANMIGLISSSWIAANIPKMTTAVAKNELNIFKNIFKKSFYTSSAFLFFSIIIIISLYTLFNDYEISTRLLSFYNFTGILLVIFMNHIINTIVIYLRCFKEEPLAIQHFICSIITFLLGVYFLVNYSITGLIIVILMMQIFVIIPISIIRLKKFSK